MSIDHDPEREIVLLQPFRSTAMDEIFAKRLAAKRQAEIEQEQQTRLKKDQDAKRRVDVAIQFDDIARRIVLPTFNKIADEVKEHRKIEAFVRSSGNHSIPNGITMNTHHTLAVNGSGEMATTVNFSYDPVAGTMQITEDANSPHYLTVNVVTEKYLIEKVDRLFIRKGII